MKNPVIPSRGFSDDEFHIRLIAAQRIMSQYKLDAVIITNPANFRYFSGFDSQFWESPTRPWFLLIPLNGEPIAVIPEIGFIGMSKTWISNIHTWTAPMPADDGISLLISILDQLPRRFGSVGAELGREMSLRMPVVDFLKLREKSAYKILDASPAIWKMRMTKTSEEIKRIHHICTIVSDAYDNLPKEVSMGQSEREAAQKLRIDIIRRGADTIPFLPAISGPGGVSQIVCGPSDRLLEKGDILFIDTGSTYDGYFCDFDRNFAIGNISDEVKRIHEVLWLATDAGIKKSVPGVKTDDIWFEMNKILEEVGGNKNNVGRLGHGVGLQLTEPPSNSPGDNTILAENMVLTIEPGIEYRPGKIIVHEENIVITNDGPFLLTKRAAREMPVIN